MGALIVWLFLVPYSMYGYCYFPIYDICNNILRWNKFIMKT